MIPDRRQRLKEAAIHSIRAGKPEDGLTTAQYLAGEDPSDAEPFQIQGLAYARLEQPEKAIEVLREAKRLAPGDIRHVFNLAAQLANSGHTTEALSEVDAALAIDPKHADSLQLKKALQGDPTAERPESHVLKFLKGRERAWLATGAVLMVLALLLSVLMTVHFPAGPTPGGEKNDIVLKTDALSQLTVILYLITIPSTFLWVLVDLVDRQKKLTWLVPMTVCGVIGLNVAPFAVYYFVGRKMGENI